MKKPALSIVILVICLTLLIPTTIGSAQGVAAQPHPVPMLDETSFTFKELREEEIRMFGPFAVETVLFGVPANWLLLDGAQLELDMTVAVQSAASLSDSGLSAYGGTLTVVINENIVAVLPLNDSGSITKTIPVPIEALQSVRADGRVEMSFLLSSSQACLVDQKMDVVIHSSSRFTIPHEVVRPDTNFANFPRPIYQDSIFLDSARIVIPDHPTAGELQAALTVAAGLQARTGNSMIIDVVTSSGLTDDKLADSHIIMVGNAGSFPLLYQLLLPMPVNDGKFGPAGDAGVLQMVVSPWSPERVVLVVSGNNDQATIKAAQALSTGVIRSNNVSNLSLISNVNNKTLVNQSSVDQTLADLGYDNAVFENRGESTETFQFYIPTGQTVTTEAYFEVSLSNSALLNYARSGVFVLLNDVPIGSIKLSDETTNQPNNRIRIPIPPSAVKSGLNYMDVTVALEPLEECADPNQTGLFVTIWNDSRLYLPIGPSPVRSADIPDLATYPAPFVQIPELSNMAFVLERDSFKSWRSAIQIAANLGSISDGVIFLPTAFYADDIPDTARSLYNIMAIGVPSKMKFMSEINDKLPGPFENGGNLASEAELQVIYQIDPQVPAGYLELLPSPWNSENTIVTVVGNSPEGVSRAANTLLNEIDRPKLLGNFAVVTDEQVLAVDTRLLAQDSAPVLSPTPVSIDIGSTATETPSSTNRPSTSAWVLIALFFTVLLIFVVIGIALYANRKGK